MEGGRYKIKDYNRGCFNVILFYGNKIIAHSKPVKFQVLIFLFAKQMLHIKRCYFNILLHIAVFPYVNYACNPLISQQQNSIIFKTIRN